MKQSSRCFTRSINVLQLLIVGLLISAGLSLHIALLDSGAYENPKVPRNGAVTLQQTVPSTQTITETAPSADRFAQPSCPSERYQCDFGWVDATDAVEGYVTVCCTEQTPARVKCTVTGPNMKYAYDIQPFEETTLSLSEGSGDYKICLLENISGNQYRVKGTTEFTVVLADELSPFLTSNPYIDWEDRYDVIDKAAELTRDDTTDLEKVQTVYSWVTDTLTYDYDKAANVEAGYLPDLSDILASETGICFDYAALTVAMLRSLNIPCKLVIGYAGSEYHAWISVYTSETGWVEDKIYFSGGWERLDPTFASTGNHSPRVIAYITNDVNYSPERYY